MSFNYPEIISQSHTFPSIYNQRHQIQKKCLRPQKTPHPSVPQQWPSLPADVLDLPCQQCPPCRRITGPSHQPRAASDAAGELGTRREPPRLLQRPKEQPSIRKHATTASPTATGAAARRRRLTPARSMPSKSTSPGMRKPASRGAVLKRKSTSATGSSSRRRLRVALSVPHHRDRPSLS
jgi:hypothetical protein